MTLHDISARSSGRTSIRLNPSTDIARVCHRHQTRKAVGVRVTKVSAQAGKSPAYTSYAPECAECLNTKHKAKHGVACVTIRIA